MAGPRGSRRGAAGRPRSDMPSTRSSGWRRAGPSNRSRGKPTRPRARRRAPRTHTVVPSSPSARSTDWSRMRGPRPVRGRCPTSGPRGRRPRTRSPGLPGWMGSGGRSRRPAPAQWRAFPGRRTERPPCRRAAWRGGVRRVGATRTSRSPPHRVTAGDGWPGSSRASRARPPARAPARRSTDAPGCSCVGWYLRTVNTSGSPTSGCRDRRAPSHARNPAARSLDVTAQVERAESPTLPAPSRAAVLRAAHATNSQEC